MFVLSCPHLVAQLSQHRAKLIEGDALVTIRPEILGDQPCSVGMPLACNATPNKKHEVKFLLTGHNVKSGHDHS